MINIKLTEKTPEVKTYRFSDLKPGDKFRTTPYESDICMKLDDMGYRFEKYGYKVNCVNLDKLFPGTVHDGDVVYPINLPKEESPRTILFKELPLGEAYKHFNDNAVYIKMKHCSYSDYKVKYTSFGLSQKQDMWTDDNTIVIPVDLNIEASY